MKKTFKLMTNLLSILFVGSLFLGLTACNKGEDNPSPSSSNNTTIDSSSVDSTTDSSSTHVHTFSDDWTFDETHHWHAATCEHTDEKDSFAAHTLSEWTTKTPATCTEAEVEHRTCSVCGYEETRTGDPATGHSFASEWKYNETHHWHEATCGHDVTTEKLPHEFPSEWTIKTPATCNEDGLKEKVCTCGYKISQSIPKLGHKLDSWHIVTDPNEEEAGSIELVCKNDNSHKQTVILPKLDEVNYSHYIEPGNCVTQREEYYKLLNNAANKALFNETMAKDNEAFYNEIFAYKFGQGSISELVHLNHTITIDAPTKVNSGSLTIKCDKCGYSHTASIPKLSADSYGFMDKEDGKWIYTLKITEIKNLLNNEFSDFICEDVEGSKLMDLTKLIIEDKIIGDPLDIIDVKVQKQSNNNLKIVTNLENSTKDLIFELDFGISDNLDIFDIKYVANNNCSNPLTKEVYFKESNKLKGFIPSPLYNDPVFMSKLKSIKLGTLPPTDEEILEHATAKHTNVSFTEVTAPSKTNPGKVKIKCGVCNKEYLITIPTLDTAGVYTYHDTKESCAIDHYNYYTLNDTPSNRALFDNPIMKSDATLFNDLFALKLSSHRVKGELHETFHASLVKIPNDNEQGLGKVVCDTCNYESEFLLPSLNFQDYVMTRDANNKVHYTISLDYINSLYENELAGYKKTVENVKIIKNAISFVTDPLYIDITINNVVEGKPITVVYQDDGKTIETVTSSFTFSKQDSTNFAAFITPINCGEAKKTWKLTKVGAENIMFNTNSNAKYAKNLKQQLLNQVIFKTNLSQEEVEKLGLIDHANFVVDDAHWNKSNTDFTLDSGAIVVKCNDCQIKYNVTFKYKDIYDEPEQIGGEAIFNPTKLANLFGAKYSSLSQNELNAIENAIIAFDQDPKTGNIF